MKTVGKVVDVGRNLLSGRFRLTFEVDHMDDFESIQNEELDIEVKKHKNKRSKDQNALAWEFIDKIAKYANVKKTDVYRTLIKELGGVSTTVCVKDEAVNSLRENWSRNGIGWVTEVLPSKLKHCTNVVLYAGSSTFDTDQMTRFIDLILQEAEQLDIDTTPLREASLLA